MKILILGATGMLGHRLFVELSKHHEVYGTWRGEKRPSIGDRKHLIWTGDIRDGIPAYLETERQSKPDVVINCIGAIPQRKNAIRDVIETNAILPHSLSLICKRINARLIHFSTDAVFSGKRGNYTEDDEPDGNDTYALTKRLGEISDQPHVLTLRCCPIGRELNGAHSLVEWFLAQTGEVKGYAEAWFNPLTTHEIARMLHECILRRTDLHGVYHVGGANHSKWWVLEQLKLRYHHDIKISAEFEKKSHRTLDTTRFYEKTGWMATDGDRMIRKMAADNALYEKVAI